MHTRLKTKATNYNIVHNMPYILRIAGQFSLGDMLIVINYFDIAQVILIENLAILCSVPDQRMCIYH